MGCHRRHINSRAATNPEGWFWSNQLPAVIVVRDLAAHIWLDMYGPLVEVALDGIAHNRYSVCRSRWISLGPTDPRQGMTLEAGESVPDLSAGEVSLPRLNRGVTAFAADTALSALSPRFRWSNWRSAPFSASLPPDGPIPAEARARAAQGGMQLPEFLVNRVNLA